jgi:predicted DNA-binding protein (MmcQ/YjbR family)
MRAIARLRRICLALPEAVEQETWEIPTFRIRNRIFALASAHQDREAVWCKAPPGAAAMLIEAAPERFFRPPYLGHKGWVGTYLEPAPAGEGPDPGEPDWDEIAFIVRRSHALVAPRRLTSGLPQTGSLATKSKRKR